MDFKIMNWNLRFFFCVCPCGAQTPRLLTSGLFGSRPIEHFVRPVTSRETQGALCKSSLERSFREYGRTSKKMYI